MFDRDELELVIGLQEKSYGLLKWVGESLKAGTIDFSYVHEAMSASEATAEWVSRHLGNMPVEIRPGEEDVEKFSHLFASYLTTSFELIEKPGVQLASSCGCYCLMCSYLVRANHLKVKKISKRAKKDAPELKAVYLRSLATDQGVALSPDGVSTLIGDPDLAEDIALATYANELIRRSQFASQGEGILVLWREIAWKGTTPKKNFRLREDKVLKAEKNIVEQVTARTLT